MNIAQTINAAGTFAESMMAWATVALPNVVAACLILAFGWWISSRLDRTFARLLERQGAVDPTLRSVLTKLARYVIMIVCIIAALSQLGVETTSALAALGAIGLAVGLALQKTLSNIAAGVMLLWLRPFSIGDYIESNDSAGTVEEIGLFATTLTTVEGIYVFVPNSELWNKKIANYSKKSKRMIRETFTISYDDDIQQARDILLSLVDADVRIDDTPEPTVNLKELADSAVALELRAWTNSSGFLTTRSDVVEKAKASLETAGLSIPYPQQDVHIHQVEYDDDEKSAA
ncbi:MAG: mechanosensitive ion channel [Alphaproteobacteria bacterium]|nr:mechanosensitive ion channel [Alphaproteobacteria bacterium]